MPQEAPEASANAAAVAELAHIEKKMQELEKFKRLYLEKEEEERNIVGKDLPSIIEAVKKTLVRKCPHDTRMVGILKDIKTGKFADSAHDSRSFFKYRRIGSRKRNVRCPSLRRR